MTGAANEESGLRISEKERELEIMELDILIIGGGPAGMAAAVQVRECGMENVLLVERGTRLGGILLQCIHDGFGLDEFGTMMTGPEYAEAWRRRVRNAGAACLLEGEVVSLKREGAHAEKEQDRQTYGHPLSSSLPVSREERNTDLSISDAASFLVEVASVKEGLKRYRCKAVIMATGCRERSRGQLGIPGSRPSGVYTAGAVQYMMNVRNYLPGRSAVILGSGDIGLIMARRMMWEGIRVRMILGEQASGLIRNYIQCVKDWNIPLKFSYTVTSIHGKKRLKGVTIAPVGEDGQPILAEKQYIPCDMLVIAAGLIPEAELWKETLISSDEISTQEPGLFICGNVSKQYDTADEVSMSGRHAGLRAAEYAGGYTACTDRLEKYLNRHRPEKHVMTAEDMEYLSESAENSERKENIRHEKDLHQSENSRIIYCINCPKGCRMKVTDGADAGMEITGNACPQGRDYAVREMNSPSRMVTTTVAAEGRRDLLIPVRTTGAAAKADVKKILSVCRKIRVTLPVKAGDVICRNIDGRDQGLDLISCDSIGR